MVKAQFPKFGSKVTFNAVYFRRCPENDIWQKVWVKGNINGEFAKPTVQEGIVIGHRWLRDGKIDGGYGSDDPITFSPQGAPIPAILVAYHPRRKPVLVPMSWLGRCQLN